MHLEPPLPREVNLDCRNGRSTGDALSRRRSDEVTPRSFHRRGPTSIDGDRLAELWAEQHPGPRQFSFGRHLDTSPCQLAGPVAAVRDNDLNSVRQGLSTSVDAEREKVHDGDEPIPPTSCGSKGPVPIRR